MVAINTCGVVFDDMDPHNLVRGMLECYCSLWCFLIVFLDHIILFSAFCFLLGTRGVKFFRGLLRVLFIVLS
jgi:hypothetical protein